MSDSQIVPYSPAEGLTIGVRFDAEEPWLTQGDLAQLYGVQVPAVSKHLKDIFDAGELAREATVSKLERVRSEGGREVARYVDHFNLDAILAVGYRVKSDRGTRFRVWATKQLRRDITQPSESSQLTAIVAALAEQVANQGRILERLLTDPQAPADVIGTAGAKHISDQIKRYAARLSAGTADPKKAYRSWLKAGANELASRLGYFGTGKSWRNLGFADFAKARPILEEMIRRAESLSPNPQTSLRIAS
jgi:hypothetical protein